MSNSSKNTYNLLNEFIDRLYDARSDEQYTGDYSVTITAEGVSLCVALNTIDIDLVADDEVLIHMNVINQPE